MAIKPQAAYDRIAAANNGPYNASTNPGGLADGGHRQNWNADMKAVVDVADYAADLAVEVGADADRFEAAVAAIEAGPVTSVNGMSGAVVLPDLPAVLPPVNSAPVAGSTAALVGGALTLSVNGFLPLYPKKQKSVRFQVATSATGFGSPVYDSGAVAGVGLSAAVTDAQTRFTGGTTYYLRAQQTDEDNFTSAWSSVTSFLFPRVPNAAAMTAPANGATGVGANNAAITLTAAAYSHPNGIAQAARRFELSKDDFITIITVAGTVGQASASIASPKDVLVANTTYKVRCVDTDANGGVATGAATTFTTTAAFRPNFGDPYKGGFYGGQDAGKDIVIADKATEGSAVWSDANNQANALVSNGFDDWVLGTQAVLKTVSDNLRNLPAFSSGGSQSLVNADYWSSEAFTDGEGGNRANTVNMLTGALRSDIFRSNTLRWRAVRLVTP